MLCLKALNISSSYYMKVATITLFYTLEFFSFGDDTIFVGCMPWVNFCLSFFEKNKNVL